MRPRGVHEHNTQPKGYTVTQLVTVHVVPDSPPRIGTNLPSITFGAVEEYAQVVVSFAGLPDPATSLRDLAAVCTDLAEQIDARPQEVTA